MHAFADKQGRLRRKAERIVLAFGNESAVGSQLPRIAEQNVLAQRRLRAGQTDRSAGIGNHQIPGTSGNVPVKFVKSIIVPELPVEQIGKVIGIDSRRQRIFFFWGQNDFVAGFFCLVRDFLPVDGDRKQGQVNFVANAGARG